MTMTHVGARQSPWMKRKKNMWKPNISFNTVKKRHFISHYLLLLLLFLTELLAINSCLKPGLPQHSCRGEGDHKVNRFIKQYDKTVMCATAPVCGQQIYL